LSGLKNKVQSAVANVTPSECLQSSYREAETGTRKARAGEVRRRCHVRGNR